MSTQITNAISVWLAKLIALPPHPQNTSSTTDPLDSELMPFCVLHKDVILKAKCLAIASGATEYQLSLSHYIPSSNSRKNVFFVPSICWGLHLSKKDYIYHHHSLRLVRSNFLSSFFSDLSLSFGTTSDFLSQKE